MSDDDAALAAYVDAAAALLAMPLDAEHRAATIAVMSRLAAFSADIAAVQLGPDIEIAGVFVP
jgi:hypothetical protein